jgi:Holliday junction resolvase RusA-like endonuclease
MPSEIRFTVPLTPPSVNHFWKHTVVRGTLHTYITGEGKAFLDAVALFARGQKLEAKQYAVTFHVYLGKKESGDLANFEKAVGDGLVKAGVIHSDAAIVEYHMYKGRDWTNPRTEIIVRARDGKYELV